LCSHRASHVLFDSDIPIEHVQYELTDLLVASLRSMPEHKYLVCNWSAMLRALQGDEPRRSGRNSISKGGQRLDEVKQRIILAMLRASAELEVSSVSETNSTMLLEIQRLEHNAVDISKKKQKKNSSTSHEELTLALLRALPNLLVSFKSENPVLQSLTTLPRYFRKCFLVNTLF
jgi:cohesin complex subunit SA-1/2